MDQSTVELICEIILCAFSGLFMIILFIRHKALRSVAYHRSESFSRKVKNTRITLQLLNIGMYSFWLVFQALGKQVVNDDDSNIARFYAFFWLPPVTIGVFAILIENQEFKLKIPLMIFHFIFYIAQFLISAFLLLYFFWNQVAISFCDSKVVEALICYAFVQVQDEESSIFGYKPLSRFSRAGIQFFIILFYIYRRQDISEFMDRGWILWDLDSELETPLTQNHAQDDFSEIQRLSSDIEVVFASDFNIQRDVPTFKITVKLDPKENEGNLYRQQTGGLMSKKYELQEQLQTFLQLSKEIQKEMSNDLASSETTLQEVSALNIGLYDNMRSLDYNQVQELRSKLQDLFDVLCQNPKYYYNCFLEFLHIGKEYKPYYIAQKRLTRGEGIADSTDEQQRDDNEGADVYSIDYFKVSIEQYQEVGLMDGAVKDFESLLISNYVVLKQKQEHMNYEITIVNQQNKESWKLFMRYSELRELHNKLKEHFEKLPPFPQKKFITSMTAAFLQERLKKLKVYLEILLNDDEYNQERYVFSYLSNWQSSEGISQRQLSAISLNSRFSTTMYNGWRAQKQGHYIQMEDMEKKGFTVYKFAIYEQNNYRGQIERRFNEFSKLHDYLELKFSADKLPELPTKISRFNTNIPKDKRQTELEMYLNSIFQITGIGTCYYFRTFFRSITSTPVSQIDFPQLRFNQQPRRINSESRLEGEFEGDEDIYDKNNSHNSQNNLSSVKIDQLQEFGSDFNTK